MRRSTKTCIATAALAVSFISTTLADPSPPAHRDKDGKLHGPGGPVSTEPRTCGPAQNHCMRGEAWFGFGNGMSGGNGGGSRVPVFKFEGHWYSWPDGRLQENTIYRTEPATLENLSRQGRREVYVFLVDKATRKELKTGDLRSTLPKSESEAMTEFRWVQINIESMDAKAGTFSGWDGRESYTYKLDHARISFDPINVSQ
jgi:hypothetical protein